MPEKIDITTLTVEQLEALLWRTLVSLEHLKGNFDTIKRELASRLEKIEKPS